MIRTAGLWVETTSVVLHRISSLGARWKILSSPPVVRTAAVEGQDKAPHPLIFIRVAVIEAKLRLQDLNKWFLVPATYVAPK